MGNCRTINKTIGCVRQENFQSLPSRVLKCPNKHWLAQFKTPECSICSTRIQKIPATISCTVCAYGLCADCYNNKILSWKKRTIKLKPEVVSQALTQINEEIDLSFNGKSAQNLSKTYNRFVRYYYVDYLSKKDLNKDETELDIGKFLTLQTTKVLSMCGNVYKSLPS